MRVALVILANSAERESPRRLIAIYLVVLCTIYGVLSGGIFMSIQRFSLLFLQQ